MEEKDYIKDLFAEKLSNAQAPVNPELWSAISSKIGSASVVSTGLSTAAKWLIGLGTTASVAVATLILTNNDNALSKVEFPKTQQVSNEIALEKDSVQKESMRNNIDSIDDFKKGTYSLLVNGKNIKSGIKFSSDNSLIGSWHCQCGSWPSCSHENLVKNIVERDSIMNVLPILGTLEQPLDKQTISSESSNSINTDGSTAFSSFEIKQLPNTFTLNNDGKNDLFFLEMKGIEDFVLTVLNSKNEIVFKSTDTNFKWDGIDLRGEQIPGGKYVYFFTGKDSQGNPISKSSNLTVIKN